MRGLEGELHLYAKLTLRVGTYFQVLPSSLVKLNFNIKLTSLNFKPNKPELNQARVAIQVTN
jgi:hypothetical protein